MKMTRRQVLQAGGALASASASAAIAGFGVGPAQAADKRPAARAALSGKRIRLKNLHTAEQLDVEFYRANAYVADSLASIQVLLRDYRNGEQHVIDPKLLDYLFDVAQRLGAPPEFTVISGYRSPQTNAQLRERSGGVAQHSLHMEGRAIDVRLSGIDCTALAAHARDLCRGGVGYYKKSDFVHLDTGNYRTWNG